jgi:hypothetical protein
MAPSLANVRYFNAVVERSVDVTRIKRLELVWGPRVLRWVNLEGNIIDRILWEKQKLRS